MMRAKVEVGGHDGEPIRSRAARRSVRRRSAWRRSKRGRRWRKRTRRKTFVLVHGAWHGGWCWRRVADLLEKRGHKVFAPTLTGNGDRSHLLSKDIDPRHPHRRHRQSVQMGGPQRTSAWSPHSYGGWPGSGALEQIGDRVVVDRLARRVQAGERRRGASTSPPSSAARRWRRRSPRASPAARGRRRRRFRQREGLRLGRFQADAAAERRRDCSRSSSPARARRSRRRPTSARRNIRRPRSTRRWPNARPTRRGRPSSTTTPATT